MTKSHQLCCKRTEEKRGTEFFLLILQSSCGGFRFLSVYAQPPPPERGDALSLRYRHSENTFLQQPHKGASEKILGGASDAQQEIGERSYFTKRVVSSRDLGVGINVLQIPGEGLAAQGVAEAFAGGNVPIVHSHHTCRQIFF